MAVNKYLGPVGLTELINLIQADFQKKQDWIQFPEMPAAADYPGKVVQFTGVTDANFTKGFFYYSTGLEWTMISVASAVEVVDQLPDWTLAKNGIIYYVTSEPACYIRNTSVSGEWFNITGDDSKSFEIVATLPAWDAADPMLIYMVPATDDSTVTGYIKDANTIGKFYQLGGSSVKSFELVVTLPSYADASPDILYLVVNGTKLIGYVKDVNTVGQFFELGAAPDPAFEIVDALPQWADADPSMIYFKADDNILTGYIKKTGTIGTWCTLGGTSQDTIDTALSATSTNPVQNKAIYAAIQDVRAQVSSVYHYKGSCLVADLPVADNKVGDTWNLEDASSYGPQGTNVAWDGTKWDALGGDLTLDAAPTDDSQHGVMSGGVYDALLTKEDVANKVTTIDATATDDQYPSAKAVHDALEGLEPIPEGFVQNVDTGMQPVEDGKVMRISKTAFDALAQRDTNVMYYLDEEHDLIDAKPTCRDVDGNLVKNQKIVELTKEQYDNLAVKDPDTYYMIANDNEAKMWYPRPDWANAVEITTLPFTAPDDGTLVLRVGPNYAGGRTFYIDGIEVGGYSTSNTANMSTLTFPICKGQVLSSSSAVLGSYKFVPWKA